MSSYSERNIDPVSDHTGSRGTKPLSGKPVVTEGHTVESLTQFENTCTDSCQ